MRVEKKDDPGRAVRTKEPFKQVLRKQPGAATPRSASPLTTARVAAAGAQVQTLVQARAQATAQVRERVEQRAEGLEANQERQRTRALELIKAELARELPEARPEACAPRAEAPAQRDATPSESGDERSSIAAAASSAQSASAPAPTQAASAIELVQRIELFVRSSRPGLSMELSGTFKRVEVERTGKNQVALTVHGRGGPPSSGELDRVRAELRQRGIEITALRAV